MLRSRFSGAICTLLAGLACAASVHAQTITTGTIEGAVVDQLGLGLSEVLVLATPVGGGASRTASSAHNGTFRLQLMPAGRYDIRAEKLGYRPKVLENVLISANARIPLTLSLVEAPPPVEAAERVRFRNAAVASSGTTETISLFDLSEIPLARREVSELGRLASAATSTLEVEGLPAWMSSVYVDGVPYTMARHPRLSRALQREIALPLNALSSVQMVSGEADAEWGGFAGGALSAGTRSGGSEFNAQAFGSWAGGALQSDVANTGSTPNNSVWGGLLLGGPIIRDTAQYSIAFEARRLQTPTPSVWALDNNAAQTLINAGTARGVQLGPYAEPYSLGSTVLSGTGRLDWQIGGNHQLSVRGALGSLSRQTADLQLAAAGLPDAAVSGRDILLSANLGSALGEHWAHELRVSFGSSTREYTAEQSAADALPSTHLSSGAVFGADPGLPGSFRRNDMRLDQSLQLSMAQHQLKFGFDATRTSHRQAYGAATGEFLFGGAADFANGTGIFMRELSATPEVTFATFGATGYVQDNWRAAPGLMVLGAVRYDVETLPRNDVTLDQQWLRATALSNADLPRRVSTVSPRFGVTWDVGERGRWIVRATGARYAQAIDALLLGEAVTEDGNVTVRRRYGNVNTWPSAPASDTAAVRLSLIAPNFKTPRSDRMSLSISTDVGAGTVLLLSGTYRVTDFLPRRSDLNLVNAAAAKDQYGRPVYGTLTQFGELLTAGVSNRRFAGYDVVSGISSDGSADYRAVTVGLERGASSEIGFFARYTYSRAIDDWPIRRFANAESQQSPLADTATQDWRHGTSDYDLPHRFSAGLQLRPHTTLQPRLALIYRYQSGYPFTPGFRDGVDANGDGVTDNDPAFVDNTVTGISELAQKWSCLRAQAGHFAERNSCRESAVQNLDVRFGLTFLSGKRTSGQLYVEGLNMLDRHVEEVDRALFLVDPARSLVVDAATGTVNVPLVANPNFGKPLARFGSGRLLRIGFQVNH